MEESEGPLTKGDPSAAKGDHPDVDEDRPAVDDSELRYSLAWWLSFAIPISIALVAILGAVVGYRAEDHASLASQADNEAQISSTYGSGYSYDALVIGQLADTEHSLWEQLAGSAAPNTGLAIPAAAEPACASDGSNTNSEVGAERAVDCRLAQVFSDWALPGYWVHGDPTAFDADRFVADWAALGDFGRDVAAAQHKETADTQRHAEMRLLSLALLLAVALAFCTLAQAATHHRWSKRPTVASLLIAIPGWILLVGCSAAVLVWEL